MTFFFGDENEMGSTYKKKLCHFLFHRLENYTWSMELQHDDALQDYTNEVR